VVCLPAIKLFQSEERQESGNNAHMGFNCVEPRSELAVDADRGIGHVATNGPGQYSVLRSGAELTQEIHRARGCGTDCLIFS
jgi:hypothetical protein